MEREQNPNKRNIKDVAKRCRIFAEHFNSDVEEKEGLEDDEHFPCGFCGVKWAQPASTFVWIKCQICGKWCHVLCVGEKGRKQFICG